LPLLAWTVCDGRTLAERLWLSYSAQQEKCRAGE